jgi:transposase
MADTILLPADSALPPVAMPLKGLRVRDVAARYRVSPDKVRSWINRGELRAINTATVLCGRPRWVVQPDALAEFERRRASGPLPKPAPRKKRTVEVDYYPD